MKEAGQVKLSGTLVSNPRKAVDEILEIRILTDNTSKPNEMDCCARVMPAGTNYSIGAMAAVSLADDTASRGM